MRRQDAIFYIIEIFLEASKGEKLRVGNRAVFKKFHAETFVTLDNLKNYVQHLLLLSAAMPRTNIRLMAKDRAVPMNMRDDQCSIRCIAKRLFRSPRTAGC